MNRTDSRAVIASPVGPLDLRADHDGNLIGILFTRRGSRIPDITPPRQISPALAPAVTQLEEYFTGRRRTFELSLAFDGTAFQRAAWQVLSHIPYGSTCSYSAQAALLGNSGAARAVGAANHRNPLPIVLPCHRVIAADGSPGGFGAGVARKLWLLTHERDSLTLEPEAQVPGEVLQPLQPSLFPGLR